MDGDKIQMVPVGRIHVLNPRAREARRYLSITRSIVNLGLKTPIVVSPRSKAEANDGLEYDLVCGQGRLEAFLAAGEREIPARVIEAPKSDRLLMGLIENMARRQVARSELVHEIIRLEKEGYSLHKISEKIDCGFDFVKGVLKLRDSGEERLLEAVMNEKISVTVANMIADATGNAEAQKAVMQAYENKEIQLRGLGTVKRLLDQREYLGKSYKSATVRTRPPSRERLVAAYQKEADKQKRMMRKARICETRLVFVRQAFTRLFKDGNFKTLLRAERLESLPEPLALLIAKNDEKR